METPFQAHRCRSFGEKHLSTPGTTPATASYPRFLKQVLLHDWWLIRADSDSHGKQLGIGGFTFKEGTVVQRTFSSAPIVKRHDAVTLKTEDGVTVLLLGFLNKSRTLGNGFSHEICDHFVIGFPYYWEEFADLSVSQERDECSDDVPNEESYAKQESSLPPPKDEKTKAESSDAVLNDSSSAKEESSSPQSTVPLTKEPMNRSAEEHVTCSGPLTRSRARLLKNQTTSKSMQYA